jgi:ankyrin repeat protein
LPEQANLDTAPVLELTANLQANVAGQLQDIAVLMNANRNTALHEAIVLANLLYSEAAKRGKVVVTQGNLQKIISLPKVPPRVARNYGTSPKHTGIVPGLVNAIRIALDAIGGLIFRSAPPFLDPPTLKLAAYLRADVASQLQELAVRMNANQNTALHEAIVLANLLYSEAAGSGTVVVRQGSLDKVISLPVVPHEVAREFGTLPSEPSKATDAGRTAEPTSGKPEAGSVTGPQAAELPPTPDDSHERRAP